ncbi:MAG: transposase [Steroidobacteraceae bacterium]
MILIQLDVSKQRGLSPVGEPVIVVTDSNFRETLSVSCLCSLDPEKPVFITGQQNSNDQLDFLSFIISALKEGYLQHGDILVLDNARIHGSVMTFDILSTILDEMGVSIVYLPAYSPELNPCELIFAQVKRRLREYRYSQLSLSENIALAFALVEHENVFEFFYKCCNFYVVLFVILLVHLTSVSL